MATSFQTFVNNIEAMSISGVTRTYQGPPTKAETVDLPSKWVNPPSATEGPVVLRGSQGGWPTLRATLVVAFEAVGQSRQPDNFNGTIGLADDVNTAIRSQDNGWPAAGHCSWETRVGIATVAGNDYWAVFVDIEGTG